MVYDDDYQHVKHRTEKEIEKRQKAYMHCFGGSFITTSTLKFQQPGLRKPHKSKVNWEMQSMLGCA